MNQLPLTLFHNPKSRSAGVRVLLEALEIDYRVHPVDFDTRQQRSDWFLAINPMGKLPTLQHGQSVVTEQVAIYLYLADRFPAAGLAPALDSADRGEYLRWMAFYGSSFEPAVVDHAMKRAPVDPSTSPYGDYDTVIRVIDEQLGRGDYLLGARISAADFLWGSALQWTTGFGIVPMTENIRSYLDRVRAHPAFARAAQLDGESSVGH